MVSGREITPIRHFEGCAANAHFLNKFVVKTVQGQRSPQGEATGCTPLYY